MKIGKVPENILKRSVFKQIKHRREDVLSKPGVGEDCAAVEVQPDEVLVFSTDPITGTAQNAGRLAVHITANDLATAGAEPVGIMVSILLPSRVREIKLRHMMEEMESVCRTLNMEILGGHTEVTDVVNQPVITVTGVGKVRKDALLSTGTLQPGDELVMTKWAGLEGTAIIAEEKKETLLQRLPEYLVQEAVGFLDELSILPEAKIASEHGASVMHDVTEGGIFGALWEIGEASGVGIVADLPQIPIRQETIESCEVFDLNPYMLVSSGSLLIGCKQGNLLVEKLKEAGIEAAVIGRATEGNDRIIRNGEETRFLEPAGSDELYKVTAES